MTFWAFFFLFLSESSYLGFDGPTTRQAAATAKLVPPAKGKAAQEPAPKQAPLPPPPAAKGKSAGKVKPKTQQDSLSESEEDVELSPQVPRQSKQAVAGSSKNRSAEITQKLLKSLAKDIDGKSDVEEANTKDGRSKALKARNDIASEDELSDDDSVKERARLREKEKQNWRKQEKGKDRLRARSRSRSPEVKKRRRDDSEDKSLTTCFAFFLSISHPFMPFFRVDLATGPSCGAHGRLGGVPTGQRRLPGRASVVFRFSLENENVGTVCLVLS